MSLKICKIPGDGDVKHPDPPSKILPGHEFTMAVIAPKGSGKTTLLCNLIMFYKKFFHKIIIFSPSIKSDEKWDYIKKQDLLVENKKLKAFLNKLKKDRQRENTVVMDPPADLSGLGVDTEEKFDAKIPEECFIAEYSEDILRDFMAAQQATVDFLKDNGKTKHLADRCLVLFDDPVGTTLFSQKKTNPYRQFCSNHRHMSTSSITITQFYKEIITIARSNFTCLILFEIANEAELEEVYKENAMGLKRNEWMKLYHHCINEPYGFLFMNHQKDKYSGRLMRNFEKMMIPNKPQEESTRKRKKSDE